MSPERIRRLQNANIVRMPATLAPNTDVSRSLQADMGSDVPPAAIVDIDGTLVDTNYQHAIAWYRAFKAYDVIVPVWRIHRHVGMGGDHLVAALAGEATEQRAGGDIREAEKKLYAELIDEVAPFEGATAFVSDLAERGN